ncbi:MAG: hypothetical protein WCC48_09975, partial [Anaeromyxobacteraceae bacterium]
LYAPVRTLVVQELRAGHLPLWNPYEGTGKPLFAEGIHSVLHPISLLGAALAPASIDFLILAYLVAAALGAFLLARTLAASPTAAAAAGLAFALSGFSVSMTGNLVFLAGLSSLPWLLAAARSAGMGARWGSVASALATACAFLSGDAQVALVGLLLGLLLAADAGGLRGLARAAAGMGAGLLLAAVQILPTAALIPRTYRSLGLEEWERTQWALTPGRLLELVIPGLFRGPLDILPVGADSQTIDWGFAESVYLGAPLLVAAALGWISLRRTDRRRTALLLGGASLALLWLALGHHLGARQLLGWVPIWGRFRYTEKLLAPLSLCVAALAALGVDAFGAARLSPRWRRALVATAAVAAAALLVLFFAPRAAEDLLTRLLGSAGTFYRSTLSAGLPHLLLAALALLAVDLLRPDRARSLTLALLVTLAPAAAVYYGAHLGSPTLRAFSSPLRLATDSPAPRVFHPVDRMVAPGDPSGQIDATARIETLFLGKAIGVALRVDAFEPYGAFEPRRLTTLQKVAGRDLGFLLRRFGLTHVLTQPSPHSRDAGAVAGSVLDEARLVQREDAGIEVWAVPHRPWAFFPTEALSAATPLEARKVLTALMARSRDEAVVVESKEPPPTAPGRVLGFERGTGTVRVEAGSDAPSLLVVQDAFWPGWRATVDGQPAEILAADILVRAVRWPAGRHTLVMTYDPPEVRLGLALSAVGALLLLTLAALALRRPRPVLPA